MNTSAIIMISASFSIVTFMTIYYFYKVFKTPTKDPEHDSYLDT